ncbi:MAG: Uncharacterised protein [Polaribacter sp. SA4-10]|nr:MAG: Uncharacterised protein [Polaribacter sp. SA4-10]
MKKKYFLLLCFLSFLNVSNAQINLSVYSEVSIVTADAGSELFEAFGHAAIRIKDPVLQLDVIYNYGMFDFNAPNFYTNFVKGKLNYQLGRQRFNQFINSYNYQKRNVQQQVLNLSQQEKQAFFLYLENNAAPKNRDYWYDPYYNNCATKLRDITTTILGDQVTFTKLHQPQKKYSLRALMRQEIPWNTWGSFGINLALGNKLDVIATESQYMYLPNYIFQKFRIATRIQNGEIVDLVKREDLLLKHKKQSYKSQLLSPLFVFILLSLLGFLITYKDYTETKRTKWFDFLILFITGIIGVVVLFLWFFTDHTTTPNNFNFLWAFAPNLLMAFLLLNEKPKQWFSSYFKFVTLLLILMLLFWIIGIQSFPFAILPFVLFLIIRYVFLQRYFSTLNQ